ncbi:unnamed protein product, partial [marine sediment metagenome]
YSEAAKDAAQKAGRILRENIDKPSKIFFKGAIDLVTNFDNQAQEAIFKHLSSCFPGHDFLAEEGLNKEEAAGFRWIFDPLDGTTNYAHNFPIFCVSIALERKGG